MQVPVGPVPTSVRLGTTQLAVQDEEGNTELADFVVMIVETPVGIAHYFFPAENAVELGNGLIEKGREARTGIVVAADFPKREGNGSSAS